MKEGWLELDGVRLHYLEWLPRGSPRSPSLLLLHGLSSNARYWERVAAQLPDRRLVAIDQRCHGLSDGPPYGYSHRTLAAEVAGAIEAMAMTRPVVAGHSWGATIALEVAARHPDVVSGLALLDGGTLTISELMTWEMALQVMHRPMPTYRSLEEGIAARRAELAGAWGDDLVPFVAAGIQRRRRGYRLVLSAGARRQILHAMYQQHPQELWPKVVGPILAGMGGGDPGPFDDLKREGASRLTSLVPGAMVRWYNGPHDFPLYLPAQVAADLDELARGVA